MAFANSQTRQVGSRAHPREPAIDRAAALVGSRWPAAMGVTVGQCWLRCSGRVWQAFPVAILRQYFCLRVRHNHFYGGAILDRTPLTPMIADLKHIDGSQWRRQVGGDDRASVNCKLLQQWFPRRWGASAPPPSDWLLLAAVDWSTVAPAAQAWRCVGRRACSSGRAERGEIIALGFSNCRGLLGGRSP